MKLTSKDIKWEDGMVVAIIKNNHNTLSCQLAHMANADSYHYQVIREDIKPRTKTEYVKYEGKFSDLAKLFEDGESLYTSERGNYKSKNMGNLLSLHEGTGVFQKVETKITWQDEVEIAMINDCESYKAEFTSSHVHFELEMKNNDFISMCHLVYHATK